MRVHFWLILQTGAEVIIKDKGGYGRNTQALF